MSENRISELEHKSIESVLAEQQRKQTEKILQLLRDFGDSNTKSNIHIIRIPGDEKECEAGQLVEELMTENFPNLSEHLKLQIQETE